jgi:DNA-binding transcriptional LysR family regulator
MLDNVTINQLRAFVAVCDQGSFSGAARELNRAQSAISHAIKALESAFDVELFERNTRKATLTAAGRSLLPDARAVIARTEEMKTRAVPLLKPGYRSFDCRGYLFSRAHLIECLRSLQRLSNRCNQSAHNDHAGRRAFGSRRHVRIGGDADCRS